MNNEIEEFIYNNYIRKLVRNFEGKEYILEKDIENLELNENEKIFFYSILKKRQIEIEKLLKKAPSEITIEKKEFGSFEGHNLGKIDEVKKAKLDYTEDGLLIGEDYSKLEQFLEEKFIPNNVVMTKRKKNRLVTEYNKEKEYDFWEYSRGETDQKYVEIRPTIQLSKIIALNLSEKENEFVISYLNKRGIVVRGKNITFDQEFENYDYYSTYMNQILPSPLTKEELMTKFILYKTTKDPVIREQIILSNLRLVPYVAWKYSVIYNIPIEELESYGYEGLIETIDKFDPKKGFSFSTYAIEYIKGKIKNGIFSMKGHDQNWTAAFLRCKKIVETHTGSKLEKDISIAKEINELMIKEAEEKLKNNPNAYVAIRVSDDPYIKRQQIKNNYTRILLYNQENIDEYIYKEEEYEDGVSFYDDKDDYNLESMFELDTYVYTKDLNEKIRQILNTLTPREIQVLTIRYGLNGEEPKELDETAKIMGYTRERIRQIEAKALRRLRHPSRTKIVRDFYTNEMMDIDKIDEIMSTMKR